MTPFSPTTARKRDGWAAVIYIDQKPITGTKRYGSMDIAQHAADEWWRLVSAVLLPESH